MISCVLFVVYRGMSINDDCWEISGMAMVFLLVTFDNENHPFVLRELLFLFIPILM